jgi:tryptophanyl-tRNA synthetase
MQEQRKQRAFTGLQPSGVLHLGNYFGAMRPLFELSQQYETFLMVADYHALTSVRDAKTLRQNTLDVVRDYLAAGFDPNTITIFRQSDNPDHTELAWILNCLVTVKFLELGHAYKDKVAKGLEANAGLFTYPMLMAADILLYQVDVVPVGEDQRQHLEYTREAANKFNLAYGATLLEPKELIQNGVGIVPGTDGQKMSKSYKNTIPLFGTREEIEKAVMSIVTDSTGERPENVYAIHRLFKSESELASLYAEHTGKYKVLKDALVEDIEQFVGSMRDTRASISDEEVLRVLKNGAERAREISHHTLEKVRTAIGITI